MNIISMKQLREDFEPIRKKIEKGQSFLLLYRSKPLCTIVPYEAGSSFNISAPDIKKEEKPVEKKVVEPVITKEKPPEKIEQPKKNISRFGIRGMFDPS